MDALQTMTKAKETDKGVNNWIVITALDDFFKCNHEIDFEKLDYKPLLVDLQNTGVNIKVCPVITTNFFLLLASTMKLMKSMKICRDQMRKLKEAIIYS